MFRKRPPSFGICNNSTVVSWPPQGDIYQTQVRSDEKGLRAERVVRLRDRPHHLQQHKPTVSVRQHRHGQSTAEVHRIQRTS